MQELKIIKKVPAEIEANFEAVKEALSKELERYNIVVTADTVVAAKKLATELNTAKKTIKDAGKAAFNESTEPANEFMKKVGKLVDTVELSRQALLAQVQKFEDETRDKVRTLLNQYRARLWNEHSVEYEFRKAYFDDLILLTSITKTENLSKSAKDSLEARVRDDKSIQDKTNMRLVTLENQSYKAGLKAPLTLSHVQAFLFADDEKYQSNLERIIVSETQRQEETENRLREQINKENARAELQEIPPKATEQVPVQSPQLEQVKPQVQNFYRANSAGKIGICVTATFSLEVSPSIQDSAIEAELRRVLEKAGINSLQTIEIARESKAA
jgi:hypothetical protein